MDKIQIDGGRRLKGEVTVSGAKERGPAAHCIGHSGGRHM